MTTDDRKATGARWDGLTVPARVRLLKTDPSMNSARWAVLVAAMSTSSWGDLSPVQQDAITFLMGQDRDQGPACDVCGGMISARDVAAFRREAGSKTALPACCSDCAEMEALR